MERRTARAAVLRAPRTPFEIRAFDVKPPGAETVLLRTLCCTICGSDVHAWTGSRPPTFLPAVIGHEIAGIVEEIGAGVPAAYDGQPLAEGDRVTFGLVASCGRCFYCTEAGLPQKCKSLFKYGHTGIDGQWALTGGLAEYVYLVPRTTVFRLPEQVSSEVAATAMCAGATLAHALEGIGGRAHRSILLIGMGMLGLWGLRLALAQGMDTVLALDVDVDRLAFAQASGATTTLNVAGQSPEAVAAFVRAHTAGEGADVCVDLTGRPEAVEIGLAALRIGGVFKLVGAVVPTAPAPVDPFRLVTRSLTVAGVHNYHPRHLAAALRLVEDRAHHEAISRGISKRFPLEAVDEAFRAAYNREALRAAVVFDHT